MKSSRMKVAAACAALAAAVIAAILFFGAGQSAPPATQEDQIQPPSSPAVQATGDDISIGGGDVSVEVDADVADQDLDDMPLERDRKATVVDFFGTKLLIPDPSPVDVADADQALEIVLSERHRTLLALPSYGVVKEKLKEELLASLGTISEGRLAELVAEAIALEERFWQDGDFENVQAFEHIYRARAILELCLEAAPTDEGALRAICDVISSGWPRPIYDGEDKALRWLYWQHKYDLLAPMYTLWKEHLSKKPAQTDRDMYFAGDLLLTTYTRDAEKALYLDEFHRQNPNPSTQLVQLVNDGFPDERRLEIAKWALEGVRAKGGSWEKFYADYFESWIAADDKGKVKPEMGFVRDQTDYPNLVERFRVVIGRGYSFVGQETREDNLVSFRRLAFDDE